MNTGQDKQQANQPHQVAQPADGSLKMHGDQLEKPLHEVLGTDNDTSSKEDNAAGSSPEKPQ